MRRGFFLGFVLFFSFSQIAQAASSTDPQPWIQKARELNLAHHPQWLNLGHYSTHLFSYRSQIDGLAFFLAGAPGKTDPAAELEATLKSFFTPLEIRDPKTQQHPICQFPARLAWLQDQLKWPSTLLPSHDCSRWNRYREKLAARSVTLVFSTYYMNSPASAFGHTFLRINKTPVGYPGERHELLDYGINYAATVDTQNALVYGLKGLLGLFRGHFTAIPYFYKVREYNDSESRDLWEYDLQLSNEEVERLVAHTWELGSTDMDYWYLDENCSYHMLTLLDAAAPRLQLAFRQKSVVIPADTVRTAAEYPGLIHSVRFRPSIQTQFFARYKKLSPPELSYWKILIDPKKTALLQHSTLTPEQKSNALDAASDYIDLHHGSETLDPKSPASQQKEQLLITRAALGIRSPDLIVQPTPDERPDIGHPSSRIGLGMEQLTRSSDTRLGIQFRLALHDRLDLAQGYPDTSEIGFFNTHLEWLSPSQQIRLRSLIPVEASTFNPLGHTIYRLSWSVRFLADRDVLGLCQDRECLGAGMDAAGGISWGLGGTWSRPRFLFWTLAGLSTRYGVFDRSKWIPSLGPDMGVRVRIAPRWNLALTLQGKWIGLSLAEVNRQWGSIYRIESRYAITDRWAINTHWSKTPIDSTGGRWGLGVFHYF